MLSTLLSIWASEPFWESLEYVAELIVLIGCIGEFLIEYKHIPRGGRNDDERHPLEKLFALILMAGLAIELGALARTNHLFDETIASLTTEARDANSRAETAFKQATKAVTHGEELEVESQTLRTRTEREIDARLTLEKRFILQGPREISIGGAKELFKKSLSRFAGQRFRYSICGNDIDGGGFLDQSEVWRTGDAVRMVLSSAGWEFFTGHFFVAPEPFKSPPNPFVLTNCGSEAISVSTRSNASNRTHSAAEALQSAINSAVPTARQKLTKVRTDDTSYPARDPGDTQLLLPMDTIDVRIGRHPIEAAINMKP